MAASEHMKKIRISLQSQYLNSCTNPWTLAVVVSFNTELKEKLSLGNVIAYYWGPSRHLLAQSQQWKH